MKRSLYSSYRTSDDGWIGKHPAHWRIKRAHFVTGSARQTVSPSEMREIDVFHYSIPNVQETGTGKIEPGEDIDSAKLVIKGPTLLVSKLNPHKVTVCLADKDADHLTVASSEFVPIVSHDICLRYARYVWSSGKVSSRLVGLTQSVTRSHQRVSPDEITKLPWAWPPLNEQQAIARFLDAKTAEIDRLIDRRSGLIPILNEKRRALITHCVTQGTNPLASRKETSVPYLPSVPAHWRTNTPLKYLLTAVGGSTPSTGEARYWVDGDIPWVSPKDMHVTEIHSSEDYVTQEAIAETALKMIDPGAVLIVVRGMILVHSFPVAISRVPVTVNQDMKALIPCPRLQPEYLAYLLRGLSSYLLSLVETSAHGTKAFRTDVWSRLILPEPPIEEQHEIVSKLDRETAAIDDQIAAINRHVSALQEYRAAIITAAVTGQIKVV